MWHRQSLSVFVSVSVSGLVCKIVKKLCNEILSDFQGSFLMALK